MVKVVTIEPVVLNLYPVPHNESYDESFTSEESHDPASTSSTTQDSYDSCASLSVSSAIMSANSSLQKKQWPTEFIIPRFSVETKMILERANEVYRKEGTLLTTPNIKSDILEKLAQSIYTYMPYPSLQYKLCH